MKRLSYHSSVDYSVADPAKVLAQREGLATAQNMPTGFSEVPGTRGESAYVFDMGSMYGALVQEGLGTKSLIAQKMYEESGVSYFAAIAQDTIATVINDLVSVGAQPVVLNAYWTSSSYKWLADKKLTGDFITGWRAACDKAGVTWGGGETQSLPGIVMDGALEFAGCGFGVIADKSRLVQEKNITQGDAIVLVESNGVHANGISLIREMAADLPKGYQTLLPSGISLGEAVLQPTHLYAEFVQALFTAGLTIHYLSNITGHGWRKIMRATKELAYRITEVPPASEVFSFIAEHAHQTSEDMYSNYNMGAGYAVYVPAEQADKVVAVAQDCGLKAWRAGQVEAGSKQLKIEPLGLTFGGSSLEVR